MNDPYNREFYLKFLGMKSILKSTPLLFGLLLLSTLTLIYITNHNILTADLYRRSDNPLSGFPEEEQMVNSELQKWIFLVSAIYVIVKIAIISMILYIGMHIYDATVPFQKIFRVVTAAEYIFLLPAFLKIILFQVYYPQGTINDWHQYYVLSALSFTGRVAGDWVYPLQSLNLFEIIYWFLLAEGIHRVSGKGFDRCLKIVVSSYIPALLVWISLITFCSLMLFPAVS